MSRKFITGLAASICLFFLTGCFGKPVRHLASDVCLMTKGTTRQEVLTYLGPPNEQLRDQYGEIWIYYQVNRSLLRKTPYLGDKFGSEDVDVVTVRFTGDSVATCAYRSLTPEEFKDSGIPQQDDFETE